jgi:hypothetical protein
MPDQRAKGKAHVGAWAEVDLVDALDDRADALGVPRSQLLLLAIRRLLDDPQGGHELKKSNPAQAALLDVEGGLAKAG